MTNLKLFFIALGLILATVSAIASTPKVDLWKLGWVSVGIGVFLI